MGKANIHKCCLQSEKYLRASGLDWTIVRYVLGCATQVERQSCNSAAKALTPPLHVEAPDAQFTYFTYDMCVCRPGGLKKTPPSEVGNLVTGKEDTLFGLPTQRGKDISRDTVRTTSSSVTQKRAQSS